MKKQEEILSLIVTKACKGDVAAQRELYELFSNGMYSICIRMVENREDAEDILQDSFVIAYKNLDKIRDKLLFAGWLKKIVINQCIRHNKKDVRWCTIEADLIPETEYVENDWLPDMRLDQIYDEIKKLPYGCRQVFSLYVIEDYSHKEIAELLSISESTSKSQYQRARTLLKKNITQILEKNGSF